MPTNPSTLVTNANTLSPAAFHDTYLKPALSALTLPPSLSLDVQTSSTLAPSDLDACLALLQTTSAAAYKASTRGWSPRAKRAEMREADMHYLLVRQPDQIGAFLSFMLTIEDEMAVVYCYEIHCQPALQGKGLGAQLMRVMETVGEQAGMESAMLTVFTSNERGIAFYKRLGYELYDVEVVPQPRRLRAGAATQAKPSYIIMEKKLKG